MDRKQMMEDNIKLAYSYCHIHNINDEDMQQEIMYAYCKAIKKYNPLANNALSTYVFTVIDNHLKQRYYLANMQKRTFAEGDTYFSLNQKCAKRKDGMDTEDSYYSDIIGYDDRTYDEVIVNMVLEEIEEKLTTKQKRVVTLMLEGNSRGETAKVMGNTNQAVTNMLARMKDMFKRELEC